MKAWPDPQTPWHWKFRLLQAETLLLQGDGDAAGKLLDPDLPASIAERDRLQPRLLTDRGFLSYRKDKLPAAGDLLEQARVLAESSARELLPEIYIRKATIYARMGDGRESETWTRKAIKVSEEQHDEYWRASAIGTIGFGLMRQYHYDEAIRYFEESRAICERQGYASAQASSEINLGWSYFRLGDGDRAVTSYARAEELAAKAQRPGTQQVALGNHGTLLGLRGDAAGGLSYLKRAVAIAESLHDDVNKPVWLENMADIYIGQGDLAAAEKLNRAAADIQAANSDASERVWPMLNSARIAAARNDLDGARQIYQDALHLSPSDPSLGWQIHDGLSELYARSGQIDPVRSEFRQAVDIIDASWTSLANQTAKFTFPDRVRRFYLRYVDFLVEHDRAEEALDFVESRRALVLSEKLGKRAAPQRLQQLAAQLNAVLLSYWLGPRQSYLWVVSKNGVRVEKLPPEAEIRGLVEQYKEALVVRNLDPAATGSPVGHKLYDVLLTPAREALTSPHVVVVPDGSLYELNFETLLGPGGKYWIEDATVEIAPSLRLLEPNPEKHAARESILLIGDPRPGDPSLPQLPNAATEVTQISSQFTDKTVLTQLQARPEAYATAQPARFGYIHFAAHAIGNRESPLDSAVALSPGQESYKLYAREVQNIPLTADLVTVSACKSAGSHVYTGEGLTGFAWAFLSAGAHNVIASLWDVNDQSTAAFMEELYRRLRRGEPPAVALRAVKLQFLRSPDAHRKPYYWAPFQIYVSKKKTANAG